MSDFHPFHPHDLNLRKCRHEQSRQCCVHSQTTDDQKHPQILGVHRLLPIQKLILCNAFVVSAEW